MTQRKKDFVLEYVHDKLGKKTTCGNIHVDREGRLWYHDNLVAFKIKKDKETLIIYNANAARYATVASKNQQFGKVLKSDRGQSELQRILDEEKCIPIPFLVIEQINASPASIKLIDRGEEEELYTRIMYAQSKYNNNNYKDIPSPDSKRKKDEVSSYYPENTRTSRPLTYGELMKRVKEQLARKDIPSYADTKKSKLSWAKGEVIEGLYYLKEDETRHYMGALLFKAKSKEDEQSYYFLMDYDRIEIEHNNFNPFIVKLENSADSIEKAYEQLKPQQVKDAEEKGLKIERQGEWFFIESKIKKPPHSPKVVVKKETLDVLKKGAPDVRAFLPISYISRDWNWQSPEAGGSLNEGYIKEEFRKRAAKPLERYSKLATAYRNAEKAWDECLKQIHEPFVRAGRLQADNNRPNRVEKQFKYKDNVYVSGKITHSGREHRDVHLEGWWVAVPNTAIKSWQVSGEID